MIEIILSGEGNSDIGEQDHQTGEFVPGPVSLLTQKLLHFNHKHDLCFHFIRRAELKKYPMTLKGKKKKDKTDATGKGHSDLAYKLGSIAKDKDYHTAVLMRDAGKEEFKAVYDEVMSGFRAAAFQRGVPAIPVPESEAWLICCLEPGESDIIEDIKEDMKKLLEQKLLEKGKAHNKGTWCEIASQCPIDKIKTPSFKKYKQDLEGAVKYLF